jgi:acetate kinase
MNILVINSGSSSLKFKLFKDDKVLVKGIIERIGKTVPNHEKAIEKVGSLLKKHSVDAVGHRVVHGGEDFTKSVIIDNTVIKAIKKNSKLAPLHNPANLAGIKACKKLFKCPQVAVFDTAFHQTMEKKAFLYPIPYKYYQDNKIRKYGFHGTSHEYVYNQVKEKKVITCHLGNGASICAIDNGKVIDTSMGLTPLEGLMMGTRSGDLDPGVIFQLSKKMSLNKIEKMLNNESGLLGISGISSDMRDLKHNKNERAKLAVEMFHHRVIKYIGAYAALLKGVEAIIFTGGIGENSEYNRKEIIKNLSYLKTKFYVIPTDEEKFIAQKTYLTITT